MSYEAQLDVLVKDLGSKELPDGRIVEAGIYSYNNGTAKLRVYVSDRNHKWNATILKADPDIAQVLPDIIEGYAEYILETMGVKQKPAPKTAPAKKPTHKKGRR
jgi:hypothetical protein